MIKKVSIVLIALVIGMVCIAGCTSDTGEATPTPTSLPVETPVATTQQAPNLMPQPTDVMPTTLFVDVATSKDPITGDITVTFRGGKGQNQVNDIKAVVISGTGATTTKYIEPNVNAEAVFTVDDGEATKGEDRVMVTVSFYDGTSYKIYDDVLSRTRTTN
ncbi:hypothetical protein L1S32_01270 [Methanogenium sp. S4BF]|uniref:hypothetical protein n=1 Tax=Methanogenium sp. S4BF TaxID=1789226 RepID=UPI002416DBC5|nr:hypothetical protein [Methanogenium sp. S4BF]WFN34782.1 hypothetical protein L1S32_01270 [Methanogenium sp. S4BF]